MVGNELAPEQKGTFHCHGGWWKHTGNPSVTCLVPELSSAETHLGCLKERVVAKRYLGNDTKQGESRGVQVKSLKRNRMVTGSSMTQDCSQANFVTCGLSEEQTPIAAH